jgi:probable phosphoglycerate mutase
VTDRLLLVRHGVTTWNREGRFQGHLDAPLADEGRTEARLLGERLAAELDGEIRIVTSPLRRAADTAAILAKALPDRATASVESDPRLVEIGQGEWEGRTHAELEIDDAERYAAWRSRAGEEQPPGAETIEAALLRVAEALDELSAAGDHTLCLVSHGGILRLAARHLLGLEARRAWAMDVDNASLSELRRDGAADAWRVARWNDTAHLLGLTDQHVDEADGRPLAL